MYFRSFKQSIINYISAYGVQCGISLGISGQRGVGEILRATKAAFWSSTNTGWLPWEQPQW